MGASRQASYPISSISSISLIQPQASDTTVDPAVQWKLVQERANQTLMELLLLVLFVVRSIVQFLRSVVRDHMVLSMSLAQEENLTPPRSLSTRVPLAPLLSPQSPSLPPVSKAVRSPQVLLVNTLGQEPS